MIRARPLAWEDVYLLEFAAEVIFVLSRVFVTADKYENEIERTLHGFRFLISAAHQNLSLIKLALTSGIPPRAPPLRVSEDIHRRFFNLATVQNWISDAQSFVEDMEFQLEKTTKDQLRQFKQELITSFHRDVLMVAVKTASRSAKLYDKKGVKFNRLEEAGSMGLPPLIGNRNCLVSVLRNVFENSIKYSPRSMEVPEIDVSFNVVPADYVEVLIRDFGLGVQVDEEHHLFIDGFRGSAAHALGAIGSGVGLNYCKELMKQYGGDLYYARPADGTGGGAIFALRIKRR